MKQTTADISKKIERGDAVVLTAQEVFDSISKDDSIIREVDVVTCGTRGIMSGTYAILSFPMTAPGLYERARDVSINGVPAIVGPCPNERLGIVDLMVFGTAVSEHDPKYGGGDLFKDLIEGAALSVEMTSNDERVFDKEISLGEITFAKLMATRHAFRNYRAIINSGNETVRTIFHASTFKPNLQEITFSGCGHINPIQNDPGLDVIGIGTRVLINGGEGFITGLGTRSSPGCPNLMMVADMKGMDPEYIGGFMTSAGPECAVSWAVPIPITDDAMRNKIARPDSEIPLPISDIKDRRQVGMADYGQVWDDVSAEVKVDDGVCIHCMCCEAKEKCPTGAIGFRDGRPEIDWYRCYNCGLCTTLCDENVFTAKLGSVRFIMDGRQLSVPVVCRQSDHVRALKLANLLKDRILSGKFRIADPVERLNS